MLKCVGLVILFLFALGAIALGTLYWIRTLQEVRRLETDPKQRRRWWIRVFFLRLIGVLWYEDHRRKQAGN